jgi:alanine dehydrogenase
MDLLILSQDDVEQVLDPEELITALAEGFKGLTSGQVSAPARNQLNTPGGFLMGMPAYLPGKLIAVKLVSVFPGNHQLGIPSHHAMIYLCDEETGVARALLDGTFLTAMRTAAGSALSTKLLAQENVQTLAIIGAGVQGQAHLRMVAGMRPFKEIRIASINFLHAQRLAALDPRARAVDSIEKAVRGADVICLCTSSDQPVIQANWLGEGMHITSVGYNPPAGELSRDIVERCRVFVETRQAFEAPPVGSSELDGMDRQVGTELGEVLLKLRPGRQSNHEITLYKSMGHAMEDLVAANLVYQRALQAGSGKVVQI